jgi:hypothetical protein
VYLDTAGGDVFHKRGSFGRSKYRIRRYGDNGSVFLERKMRRPKLLAKRRTLTSLQALDQLAREEVDETWAGSWFHRRLIARRLGPVCRVQYHRVARAIAGNGDGIRLTLDADLAVLSTRNMSFSPDDATPFLNDQAILELKYRGDTPTIFKELLEHFALTPEVVSKYRLGIMALHPEDARTAAFKAGARASHA